MKAEVDVEPWYGVHIKVKPDGNETKRVIDVSSMKLRKELDVFEVNFVVFLFNSQLNEMKINF